MKIKNIHIFGGGTVSHITSHLALSSPAYGTTARRLHALCLERFPTMNSYLELTKMAGGALETNDSVLNRIYQIKSDPNTKIVFFNCALVDWEPTELLVSDGDNDDVIYTEFGKYNSRLESRAGEANLWIGTSPKIVPEIRRGRKDIFLVAFKTTCGASKQEMYLKGLKLCKEASCNLVLVNDVQTRWNMIVTPEEAAYHETQDRDECLINLVDMAFYRSHLTFTQSTVVSGNPIPWDSELVPDSLRQIVNHAIAANAYKVFNNSTVGHFACKLSDREFLTSIRKSDFNKLNQNGLVKVVTDGPDTVIAYGAKPSVGGQSQRMIFKDHPEMDCVVHFHCPLKEDHPDDIPIRSQRDVECGSHQCGANTSNGLKSFGNLKAVMLDKHGPNIVFNQSINPKEVIDFIDRNFDLDKKTGGYQL